MTNESHILHIENIVALICNKYEQHRLGLEIQYLIPYEEMQKFSHLFQQLESKYKNYFNASMPWYVFNIKDVKRKGE